MFGCACGRWWSVWKPKTLCGARDALCLFGELVRLSGGGCVWWIIAHSETLNVQIWGCGVGAYMGMGKPWVRSDALELFRLFRGVWKLGEVVLRVWKPRLCAFVKLRGAFRGTWKLERLIWARKNLGV